MIRFKHKNKEFILLNSPESDKFRVLVQTDERLPAPDLPVNSIRYTKEGIEKAIPDLKGKMVYDDTMSNHQRKRNPATKAKPFAQVVDTHFEDNKGYVDIEVFDEGYLPRMRQMHKSFVNGLDIDEGFSTEVHVKAGDPDKNNDYSAKKFNYSGLALVNKPRQKGASVCDIIVNSLPGDKMVKTDEKIEISKEEYEELKQAKKDNKTKDDEIKDLKGKLEDKKDPVDDPKKNPKKEPKKEDPKIDENLEKELAKRDEKLEEIENSIAPFKAQMETKREEMITEIVNSLPEADRGEARKHYEKQSFNDLEMTSKIIVNNIQTNKGNGITDTGGSGSGGSDEQYSDKDFESDYEAAYGEKPE